MNLILSLYSISDNQRKSEVEKAIEVNVSNKYIKSIIILNEGFESIILNNQKIETINIDFRPTFNDLLNYCKKDEVNIISNNDIIFDETIYVGASFLKRNKLIALALTRFELNGELFRAEFGDSQDSWMIWSDSISGIDLFHYYLGVPGCDNRFAYDLEYMAKYVVFNPSKTIKTIHLHSSMDRNYSKNDQLKGNYLLVKPTKLYLARLLLVFSYFDFLVKWKLQKK